MRSRPETLPAEWLDSLPSDAPEAQASRRDLRVFNRLLGTEEWVATLASNALRPGERVLELGAGDGALAGRMLAKGLPWDALDLAPEPRDWPEGGDWFQADALSFGYMAVHAVVVANLVLHHFDEGQLGRLGARIRANARVILVSDLERSGWRAALFPWLCRLIKAHEVSRHDGALSIRAGFRRDELPRALGLSRATWSWKIQSTLAGAYRLVAIRRA